MSGKSSALVCLWLSLAITLAFATVPAIAMTAYSVTYKELVEEGGKEFWQIRVTCTDLKTKRFLVQAQDQDQWCAKQLPDFCANHKIQAALNICSSDYELAVSLIDTKQGKPTKTPVSKSDQLPNNRSLLLQEQTLIQSERVELAKRKLDLQRREIDLEKRELEMFNRLENLP